jgi:hypothetical protein
MWKYAAVGVVALMVGAVASPIILRYVACYFLDQPQVELLKVWSSEGKDWTEFSRFIEAGGRTYWRGAAVINGLETGTDEEDIRKCIGPPDAVLIGINEISNSFRLGAQSVPKALDNRYPLDFIPYLTKGTSGLYIYKMGRIARDVSYIEQSVMRLEFSPNGKLLGAFTFPVSPSNPIGDFTQDTRTNRRIRAG